MHRYKDLSGKSGITHYFIGDDFIAIKFKGEIATYIYSYSLCGKNHIENMKGLALKGYGLSTYISQHLEVRDHFDKK